MTSLHRPGYTLEPVVETWEATVYQVTGSRTAFLVVPRTSASGFQEALGTGQIDSTITDYLNAPDTGRTLDQHTLMLTLGLFDRLGDTPALAAPERDPLTGVTGNARDREDKNQDQQTQQQTTSTTSTITTPTRALKWPILVGAGIAVIALAGIGIAVAAGGGGTGTAGNDAIAVDSTNDVATGPAVAAGPTPTVQAIITGILYKDPVSKVACMRFADGRETAIGLPDVEAVRLEVEQDWQNATKLTFVDPATSSRVDIAYGAQLTAPGQVTPNPFPNASCGPFTAEILGMPR